LAIIKCHTRNTAAVIAASAQKPRLGTIKVPTAPKPYDATILRREARKIARSRPSPGAADE
jgi:hypothetical protein